MGRQEKAPRVARKPREWDSRPADWEGMAGARGVFQSLPPLWLFCRLWRQKMQGFERL